MLRKVQRLNAVIDASIGRILDYGWQEDRLWYATPWYEGHTLEQLVEQGPLSQKEAIDIFAPLARALATMHQHGVVHRELAANNILILRVGAKGAYATLPVLTGFDSWILGEISVADEPRWLAPESAERVLRGADIGAPAPSEDVFSLALAMLCALDPAINRDEQPWRDSLAERMSGFELRNSSRVAPFAKVLARALAVDPAARPSAAELTKALEATGPTIAKKRARRGWLIPLSVFMVASALLVVTYFVHRSRVRLIDETLRAADVQVLTEELEAEKARAKGLEEQLNETSPTKTPAD
jgi:serine/threonine-protein kinase